MISIESIPYASTMIEVKYVMEDGSSHELAIDLRKIVLFKTSLANTVFMEIAKQLSNGNMSIMTLERLRVSTPISTDYIRSNMDYLSVHRLYVKGGAIKVWYERNEDGEFNYDGAVDM